MENRTPAKLETNHYNKGTIYYGESLLPEGQFAAHMIEKWGMVAATPDGEDSAGRQKMRLATPEELVERAIETTNLLFRRMREEGMTFVCGFPKDDK
jgi:hypothetical protein